MVNKITVTLNDYLYNKVIELAEERHIKKTDFIRYCIQTYIVLDEKKKKLKECKE